MSENRQKCPGCSESVPLEYSICPFCGYDIIEYELKKFSYQPSYKEVFRRFKDFYKKPISGSAQFGVATETRAVKITLFLFSVLLSLRLFFTITKLGLEIPPILSLAYGEEGVFNLSFYFVFFLISLLFIPLIFWLIYLVVFRIGTTIIRRLSVVLGGDLTSKQVRTIFGYTLLPIVIGEFLGVFLTLFGPKGSFSLATINYEDIFVFMRDFFNSGAMIAFNIVMIISWVACLAYTAIAFRTVGKMPWANAVISLSVPLGLFVLFFYLI